MVFVNDKKYACETCIKGHRSSTCNHTERPLFEIKKKGRPITQCEHCRELRKTKQVHVKCVCEGRGDLEPISHSIPAKKANRKGPIPSAAFPFGLQAASAPTSDSEDAPHGRTKTRPAQRSGSLPPCACKKSNGPCNCCTPRHVPRAKRSLTPPMSRPKIGDIRATAPALHRPSSDAGDAYDVEPEPHALTHGHGTRITHGSTLFNPYGHAHDAHLRNHDMREHGAVPTATLDASNGYVYPVPPISFGQHQTFGAHSEPSPAWPNGERLSDDVMNAPSTFNPQGLEGQPDVFGAVNFGSVDVDAWLQEIMVSGSNPSAEADVTPSSNIPYSESRADIQTLPVPQALDISRDLAQAQDPDYASAPSQFDLLPQLGNLDLDYNDTYLSSSEQDVGDVNGLGSTAGMFDSELFNCAPAAARSEHHRSDLFVGMSVSPSASTSARPPPPMLTVQSCNDFQYMSPTTIAEPRPQDFAFDLLSQMMDTDYVVRPPPGVPALTRSPSIGSHSSSRSRSSYWVRNGSTDRLSTGANANASVDDQWHSTPDTTSYRSISTAENSWGLSTFPSVAETAREWPAGRVQAYLPERGRAPRMMDVPLAKDATPNARPLSFH